MATRVRAFLPTGPSSAHASPPGGRRPRRRVLVLNHEFPPLGGGAAPVAYEISRAYVERGHAVSVVTMGHAGLPRFELKDGMQIFRIWCVRRRREICTVPEMLTFVLSARSFLRRHLQTHAYDVVHAHFIVPSGAIALWAERSFALPYIVTSHGSDVLGYNERFKLVYPMLAQAWADILKQARAVTSPTAFLAARIQHLDRTRRVVTIPHAVDPRRFRPLPKEDRILVVGRLITLKGVHDVLEALATLDLRGWQVDIVGDGPCRAELEQKASARRLTRYVTFHGWMDNRGERMRELYGKARVYVSASYQENMSVALLEALAAGCRVVASDAGGTAEVVEGARLFAPGDVTALAERIASAMRSTVAWEGPQLTRDLRWSHLIREYEALCFQ